MRKIEQIPALTFLAKSRQIYKDPLPFHRENFKKYGNTFKISPKPGLMIHFTCDEKITQHILQKNQKNFNKSTLQTEDLGKYIGHGLLTENGEKWRANRKLIQPAFYKKSISSLMRTMDEVIQEEFSKIKTDQAIDVYEIFNNLAFKVVARSLFDLGDIDDLEEKISRLQFITEKAQKMLIKELRIPWMKWYFDREWLSGDNSVPHALELIEEARDILRNIINNRRSSDRESRDLLDMLLHSTYEDGSYMEDDQLVDEILVLFIAGHETTANALSFAAQLLAQHPETIAKASKEISHLDNEDLMTGLMAMPYIKQCVDETLRMYPPAYVTDRVALEADSCEDIAIEKGSIWLISFYEMHRRKDLWKDPEVFNPDRFAPGKAKEYRDFYFPFGAGPRMCVGNNFAVFEMILVIARMLERFDITPVHDFIDYHPLITLKPRNAQLLFKKKVTTDY
ncbi:cytochrome P450 [Nonlabens sp. MB-3u-79]|uniref:cytochrome P450 n=1 Tax=Nonlabens sp. MB-3u-79 TaxID=2058134 RepID=UPI000C304801|nr:cytochrome P450 [Nonlabens sp. MB-3u-79]AUC78428.1 cytochrome P450 [Nonlabens sp. MB-3u-79]|tara:strand:- start:78239 stop:79597 length:1359 start_codon:yes stop_codon:yes gene_type:complete